VIDGRRTLDVEGARWAAGTGLGLWTDHAAVRVRDFRLDTLS